MAFTVQLYEFSKRTNSTLRPSGSGISASCEAYEPLSVISPVFKFRMGEPYAYNYMFVPEWDRYYWIDNWTYDKGLWLAACSIDPLSSWRDSIGAMTEYVLRSYADYDPEIMDTAYPMQAEAQISQVIMPGWSVSATATGCHVVGIVSANGLVEYYVITDLETFGAYMFGDDASHPLWDNVVADDPGLIEGGLPSFMKAQFNPLQYVVSCIWYPFIVPYANAKSNVYFGYFNSGYKAYKVTRSSYNLFSSNISIPDHPQIERGNYLNMAPYTRLRLSALPWGEVDLDTTKFANKSMDKILLEAWLDPVTGSTKLYIGIGDNTGGNGHLLTLVGQIGVTEQLSQVLKDNLSTVTGGLSAVAGLTSMFTGNIIGGIASTASSIGNAISAQYPDVSTTGTNGARIAVCPTNIWLTATHQLIVGEDQENHGRPLCERRKISTLPGFLMISDPDVKIPATKAEIDQIKEFMVNGFFYE